MIILDMEMPLNCNTCELQYVCPIYKNTGIIERDDLKLDKKRHPNCIIKGVADNVTKAQ